MKLVNEDKITNGELNAVCREIEEKALQETIEEIIKLENAISVLKERLRENNIREDEWRRSVMLGRLIRIRREQEIK